MYTRCPHCLTVFMVAAEQLKAAHGNVRCGTCLESFDAIPHLSDGPVQAKAAIDRSQAYTESEPADPAVKTTTDTRSASEKLSSTLDAVRAAASAHAGDSANGAGRAGARASDPPSQPGAHEAALARAPGARADHLPETASAAGAAASEDNGDSAEPSRANIVEETEVNEAAPLPEVLRADADAFSAERAARNRNIAYGAGALALTVLLASQYVFFMPEDAARRYPQFRSTIESVCIRVGCMTSERRDPSRIRVLSRDVRVHPRYEGVMQIKATLTNAAPYRQPYPEVRFTLFNVNGQTIASRVFEPSEYLGRPVAASARLRPNTPFQVELDVLAPGEAAVSFEFQFL